MAERFDLIVLGSGPGGYVAAIRAAQLGLSTAIVERAELGGICLNWGCIPTKALLRTAEVWHNMQQAEAFGLSAGKPGFDLAKVVARSRQIAGQLNAGVKFLMKKNKVTVVEGSGALKGNGRLAVAGNGGSVELEAANIIVATGARARDLPFAKADGKRIWTYRHAMVPEEMPSRLLVVGSGAIGVEFASFYGDMGTEVTLVEALDRVLPVEDAEISDFVAKALAKRKIRIMTSAGVESLKAGARQVEAVIKGADGKTLTESFSHVIVAIGIDPNSEDIGLEALGVKTTKGHIDTDPYGRTNVAGIWAIGDVAAPPWLAHKAMHEGVVAVEAIAGVKGVHPLDRGNIPGCTYSRPQVASVGLTEARAKEGGHAVRVGRFPLIGNGKAIALGDPEGLIKTLFDEQTGELLGAHLVGPEVTELIHGFVVARTLETTEEELMRTIYAHPTLSEAMHESVLSAYGRALHI
jgi:dihydrolipoamide dehydrogenase